MSFCNAQNIILNHDVEFKNIKFDQFLSNISNYSLEVSKPTIDITYLLRGKINYIMPISIGCVIRNNRLETFNVLPNLYRYQSFDEVIKHLSDDSKDYFLVKVERTQFYNLYVVERSRLAQHRDEKIDQILHGIY